MVNLLFDIIQIVILLFSIVLHEIAHGYAALRMGDPTAKYEGRLTLNPVKHMDPLGSVLIPLLTFFMPGPMFGWAKPVPVNPYNFKDRKKGEIIVSFAGPAVNIAIGVVAALLIRFFPPTTIGFYVLQYTGLVNLFLAFFNLFPVPPLDGSHIVIHLLPGDEMKKRMFFQKYGFILLFLFLFSGVNWIFPIVSRIFAAISGLPY